jgi:hypothetical protein
MGATVCDIRSRQGATSDVYRVIHERVATPPGTNIARSLRVTRPMLGQIRGSLHVRSVRGRRWLVSLFALFGAAMSATASAQESERFEVRNAYVELVNGAWLLDVRLDLALADAARQAFEEGVPLVLRLEAEASVDRRLLPADEVASLTRKWQLAYDAIAQRYVVTDVKSGTHVSHATQEEAFEALGRISGVVLADTAQIPDGGRFDVRVRATVEIGELPAAVRMLLFWRSWSRTTEWYSWKVRP